MATATPLLHRDLQFGPRPRAGGAAPLLQGPDPARPAGASAARPTSSRARPLGGSPSHRHAAVLAPLPGVVTVFIDFLLPVPASAPLFARLGVVACAAMFPRFIVHSLPVAPCVPPCFFACL